MLLSVCARLCFSYRKYYFFELQEVYYFGHLLFSRLLWVDLQVYYAVFHLFAISYIDDYRLFFGKPFSHSKFKNIIRKTERKCNNVTKLGR